LPADRPLSSRRQARLEREQRKRRRIKATVCVAALLLVGLATALVILVFSGRSQAGDALGEGGDIGAPMSQEAEPTAEEIRLQEAVRAGAAADDPNVRYLPTPLIAEYGALKLHAPVSANHITEIEFHQASYSTALQLTSLVTIVDAQEVADRHGTNHIPADEQSLGDAAYIGEAVSTWRLDSVGPEMSSVDVGASAGTDVYAPVSGTVVKIKTYSLYGILEDYEVHIQVPDHPEWDIVLLHIDNLSIEVGDKVRAGSTRIARIRDIGWAIDNNLSNFTAPGDTGNHCHMQVNDATREDYQGLEGALDIFS
jgi:biotin carboxyl carrier protein